MKNSPHKSIKNLPKRLRCQSNNQPSKNTHKANIHVFVVPDRQVLRVDPDEDHVLPVGPDRHVRRVDPDEDHVRPFDPVDPDDHVLPVDPDEGS